MLRYWCIILILLILSNCHNGKSPVIVINEDIDSSEYSQELLYILGGIPDTGISVPNLAIDYGQQTVEYPYLAEKGLDIDTVFKMRSTPSHSSILPIFPEPSVQDWPFCNEAIMYLSKNNIILWNRYILEKKVLYEGLFECTPLPVYYWEMDNDYILCLVCCNIGGAERVIYGKYAHRHYFYSDEDLDGEPESSMLSKNEKSTK